jgi:superfamily II RNA helicase
MSGRRRYTSAEIPPQDETIEEMLSSIGTPQKTEFKLDDFQKEAIEKLNLGAKNLLVVAPTGSGKTYIAESYIKKIFNESDARSIWYTTPMRALSNDKYHQFSGIFGRENVGIITGDTRENINARFVIATTESYRNLLISSRDFKPYFVVVDELHFMNDPYRGKVWEEVIMLTPIETKMLFLSATIGNPEKIREWIASVRGECELVIKDEHERPVKLKVAFVDSRGLLFTYPMWLRNQNLREFDYKNLNSYVALLKRLESKDLLPAIFYIPTRRLCEEVVEFVSTRLNKIISEEDLKPYLNGKICLSDEETRFIEKGFVQHHAGRSPQWRRLIEDLMRDGKLRAVCATTTLSAGIDFPARTVFISTSQRPSENGWVRLSTNEVKQISGRAGRRGKDNVGFVLITDESMLQDIYSPSDYITSSFEPSYMLILNSLKTYSPEELKRLIGNSFFYYTNRKRIEKVKQEIDFLSNRYEKKGKAVRKQIHRLKQELYTLNYVDELLTKRIAILKDIDFIKPLEDRFILTQNGELASNIKRDTNFLQLSIALISGVFDKDAPILAAMLFGRLAQGRLVTKSRGRYGKALLEVFDYCRYYESRYGLKDEQFSYSAFMERVGEYIVNHYKKVDFATISSIAERFNIEEGDLYKLIVDVRDLLYTLSDVNAPCSYIARDLIEIFKWEE